jgi:hypothetical protein
MVNSLLVLTRSTLFYLSPWFLVMSLICAACSSEDDPPLDNGVNDVRQACDIRMAWKNPSADKCSLCQAAAPVKPCGCEAFAGFDGVCQQQGEARRGEASCVQAIDECVVNCAKDCGCVEACYANAPACKQATAARDGCIAKKCTAYCEG